MTFNNEVWHSVALLGIAIALFASTNFDDLLVLLGFYANPEFRVRHIVFGQYLGIGVLFCASAVAAALALIIAPTYVGLLGVLPLGIGTVKLWRLATRSGSANSKLHADGERPDLIHTDIDRGQIFTVAMVTIANGADNIVVYTPWFSTHTRVEIAMVGGVFAVMTAAWLRAALWLADHRRWGAPIRRYGQWVLPLVLMGLGAMLLGEAVLPDRLNR